MKIAFKKALIEITGVADGFRYPEHTYYLQEGGKCIGYKKESESHITVFTKPLKFDRARRKFRDVSKQESKSQA